MLFNSSLGIMLVDVDAVIYINPFMLVSVSRAFYRLRSFLVILVLTLPALIIYGCYVVHLHYGF